MHRIPIINELYEIAKLERQNGNPDKYITPFYFGIDIEGKVSASHILLRTIAENPIYIIGHTVHHYQNYGARKDGEIFCFINQEGKLLSGIALTKWSLTEIKTFQTDMIEGATFKLVGTDEKFVFHERASTPLNSMDLLWKFFQELDLNCSTIKEAELYYKYFIQRLELNQANLGLDDYREQLEMNASLINQYKELLSKIEAKLS